MELYCHGNAIAATVLVLPQNNVLCAILDRLSSFLLLAYSCKNSCVTCEMLVQPLWTAQNCHAQAELHYSILLLKSNYSNNCPTTSLVCIKIQNQNVRKIKLSNVFNLFYKTITHMLLAFRSAI